MRRIVLLLVVLLCSIPVGVSLSGCSKGSTITYCEGSTGVRVGQITSIDLEPRYYGKSIAFGQTDTFTTPTAADCKGTAVSTTYKYSSSNTAVVDINPTTGQICAGQWNRNGTNGIPDYTYCNPGTVTGTSNIVASGGGATSNPITVYVHAPVASISIGNPCTTSTDPNYACATNPSTDYCPIAGSTAITAAPYDGSTCISQRSAALIVARAFDANGNNITCSIGHPTFNAVTSSLISIDENGQATALLPGSTVVTATVARNTSTAGLFSVCPPASIALTTANSVNNAVTIYPNTTESVIASIFDTKGVQMSGLNLTYTSTTPTTVTAASTGVLATYPSAAAITAYCEPPNCNPSPTQSIGNYGNGKPVASNSVLATANGLSGTQMYVASTESRYLVPVDFVLNSVGTPIRLPAIPNSMVISNDGASIYLGTANELVTVSASSNAVSKEDMTVQGSVLAVSPDSSSIVVADPTRKITTLYGTTTSAAIVTFNGVAKSASYSPDSATVYIATAATSTSPATTLTVYNTVTGLTTYDMSSTGANDVTVTVPHLGAYVAGNSAIVGRSYCANSTVTPITDYYPVADTAASAADKIISTNDGKHVLGARLAAAGGTPVINDLVVSLPVGACPLAGTPPTFTSVVNPVSAIGVTANSVAAILPSSDAKIAFLLYTATASATGTGTILPGYRPAASGPGTLVPITLATGATAPVAGVYSTNNQMFYVGTSGDNLVHLINLTTLTDGSQIAPKLPLEGVSGYAVPNLIVQKPRATT